MPPVIDAEKRQFSKMANFKSTGPDGIPNFWLKQFDALHDHYARAFNELIQGDQEMDEWLTEGNTFLIPKSEETQPPTNNVQTFNRNHHRNDAPPPNTTRRPRGRIEGM